MAARGREAGALPGAGRQAPKAPPRRPLPPPVRRWDIYQEHLEEAGFLWTQWLAASVAPGSTLLDLELGEEERLRAHIDALVVGGLPVREKLLMPALEGEEPEPVFAAVSALLAADDGDFAPMLLEQVKAAPPGASMAWEWAFLLAPTARATTIAHGLLAEDNPDHQAMGLRLLGQRPDVLLSAEPLERFLRPDDPQTAVPALRALPGVAQGHHGSYVERALAADEPAIEAAALEAGCILGLPNAWRAARRSLETRSPAAGTAALLLCCRGVPAEVALIAAATDDPSLRREALWALGFAGTWAAIEGALRWAADDEVGPLAAEAFCMITGVNLARDGLAKPAEEEEDDDADSGWIPRLPGAPGEDAVARPDDDLPAPDGPALKAWWEAHKSGWKPMLRYLDGQPLERDGDTPALLAALERGSARRWAGLALALALETRGAARLPSRGWARDRRRALARVAQGTTRAGLRTR